MAMISCPECGKEISDKAAYCPSCGAPISTQGPTSAKATSIKVGRTGGKWEGLGFILIVAGMITAIGTDSSNHLGGILVTIGFVVFIFGRFN